MLAGPRSRCFACARPLSSTAKNAASGFENLGFGLYHSALEIWGKEISFGHSKRYKSGVFAVKPKRAQVCALRPAFPPARLSLPLSAGRHGNAHALGPPT